MSLSPTLLAHHSLLSPEPPHPSRVQHEGNERARASGSGFKVEPTIRSQERPGGVATSAWYAPTGCAGRRCSALSSQESPWPGALDCDGQGQESAEGSPPCRAGGAQCCREAQNPCARDDNGPSEILKPPVQEVPESKEQGSHLGASAQPNPHFYFTSTTDKRPC